MCVSSATGQVNNMQRRALHLITLLLALGTAPLFASEEAAEWLERMSRATHELNYQGTFVYMKDQTIETMRLIHASDEQGERERLVSLSGSSREVIRQDGQVTCYLPEKEALVSSHPSNTLNFPISLPTHWEQLRNVYDFKVQGEQRVAGRPAVHVTISPRDTLRYGQNYWIDRESGLLLRSDIIDGTGEVLEQLEFTSLQLMDKVAAELFQPEAGSKAVKRSQEESEPHSNQVQSHWQLTNPPAGFTLDLQRQHTRSDSGVVIDHLIYSDGLTSVSVFIEPLKSGTVLHSKSLRRGSINIYSRQSAQQRITVLGEVPLATVKQIGDSIVPLGN